MRVGPFHMWFAIASSALVGCVEPATVECGDGTVCPGGSVCATVTTVDGPTMFCVDESWLGCTDGEICDAGGAGTCHDGVCFPNECGNGLVDLEEACDDANNVSGDTCSADCRSNETCGNGVVDVAAGEQCDDGIAGLSHDGCSSTCQPETLAWHDVTPAPIGPRAYHAMASFQDRVIVFGGIHASKPLDDTWEWDGYLWRLRIPARRPSARGFHAMAYDQGRQRVVLFGGLGAERFGDTWEWDGTTWIELNPPVSPSPRSGAAMTYDAQRQVVVLFGGGDGVTGLTDTWEWNGTTWTQQITATAPTQPSYRPTLAFDPTTSRVVYQVKPTAGETWEYDGTNWAPRAGTQPNVQMDAVMFDPVRNKLVGVNQYGQTSSQTWEWGSTGWAIVADQPQGPALNFTSAMAYHDGREGVVAFGGIGYSTGSPLATADVWLLPATSSTWTKQVQNPASPQERAGHASVFDSRRGEIVLFGGARLALGFSDTWIWSQRAWRFAEASESPSARVCHAMAYDAQRGRVVLFGGAPPEDQGFQQPPNADTWEWTGTNWELRASGLPPAARCDAAMAYDQRRAQTIMFGGGKNGNGGPGSGLFGETWAWDGTSWTDVSPAISPSARRGAGLVYDAARERIVLFGGSTTDAALGELLADTWEWDGATWTQLSPAVSPPPRQRPAMYYDANRRRVVVTFGLGLSSAVDDAWEWDGATWTRLQPGQSPSVRTSIAYNSIEHRAISFGGFNAFTPVGDTWALEYGTPGQATELCIDDVLDDDGDTLSGCADLDCWGTCTPLCAPAQQSCPADPVCGDGTCSVLETPQLCAADCPL